MRLARALVASLVVFAFTAPAGEVDAASRSHAEKKKPRSVGAPNHGKLEGASLLHGGKHLIFRHGAHSYGTPELTHALKHAAEKVANKYAGSVMLLGDLSGKEGGQLAGHGSHQSGRDADVGFYVENSRGKPVKSMKQFVSFDDKGEGKELAWARFDEARNWLLIETLLKDKDANVKTIFVVNALKARLHAYATKHHAPKELVARAAQVMVSTHDADLHDSHFHVRIACPAESIPGCIEEAVARPAAPSEPPTVADQPAADDARGADVGKAATAAR